MYIYKRTRATTAGKETETRVQGLRVNSPGILPNKWSVNEFLSGGAALRGPLEFRGSLIDGLIYTPRSP